MQLRNSSEVSLTTPLSSSGLQAAGLTVDTHALRMDHQNKVAKLFSDFENLKDSDEKKAAILTRICVELTLQEHVEAQILAHAAAGAPLRPI